MLCPTRGEPWQRSGIEVKLTKPLPSKTADKPKPSTSESRFPWSMRTFSGIKCVALTGTVPVLHHVPGVYGCSNGEYLWGAPSRNQEPWTIYIAPSTAKKLTHKAKIKVAWF